MKNKIRRDIISIYSLLVMICVLTAFPVLTQAKREVSISPSEKTIAVGKTVTIKLKNNSKKVKWSTSNKKIKILSKSNKQAKIKGIKKGTSYVKAKVGGKTYKCKIVVEEIDVLYIDVDYDASLNIGEIYKVKCSIYPKNATNKEIIWTSSDESVATVNKNGVVKAIKVGISKITATVGDESASCSINVYETINKALYQDKNVKIDIESISFSDYPDEYRINLVIENTSERDICVQARDTSINGYMVDPAFSSDISAGKKIKDDLSVLKKDVIGSEIKTMELKFYIFDDRSDDDFGYNTETVKIF